MWVRRPHKEVTMLFGEANITHEGKIRCLGHLERMDQRIPEQIMNTVPGKLRPKKKLCGQILKDLAEKGTQIWKEKAGNRKNRKLLH